MPDPTPDTPPLSVLYATDEHVAIRAGGDFATLAPAWQSIATGADGLFAAGSPWTLASNAVDFGSAGVAPGCVCHLSRPTTTFRGTGLLFAVDSVAGRTVILRPIGRRSAGASSPVPDAGLTGVAFAFPSLRPQIEEASFDLNRRYGVSPTSAFRSPEQLAELRDLRAACVTSVLLSRYTFEARGKDGDFRAKAKLLAGELESLYARLAVRWLPTIDGTPRPTTRFGLRFSR